MESVPNMEEICSKRQELFFNNLVLLDSDSRSFEKEYNVSYHKNMFAAPNKKGFEIVTHFLFLKLSSVTQLDYNLPWPLVSKENDKLFQKICFDHLGKFAEENIVKFPRIVPSILLTFGGERFYKVYFAFSTYVLWKTMDSKGMDLHSRPVVTKENFKATGEILQLSIILTGRKFKDVQMVTQANNQVWSKLSKHLLDCLENLKESIKYNKELFAEIVTNLKLSIDAPLDQKLNNWDIIEKLIEYNIPAEHEKLENFFQKETELWEMLASKLSENEESLLLNGKQINIYVPDDIPDNIKSELKKTGFTTSEVDGKLSVTRFLKLLEVYLKLATEVLMKAELSNLYENCSVEDVNSIHGSLKSVAELIKKLYENDIPEMKKSIKDLRSKINFEGLSDQVLNHELYIPLRNLSLKPDAVKDRVSHFEPGELFEFAPSDLKEQSKDNVFTKSKSDYTMKTGQISSILPKEEFLSGDVFPDSTNETVLQVQMKNEMKSPLSSTSLLRRSWLEVECLFSISNHNISLNDL